MALSWDDLGSTNPPVTAISQVPKLIGDESDTPGANNNVARQIILTQTLTQDGSITTAVVTLDRGAPPTEAPPPPDRSSGASGSLPPHTIGLIVGITVGIVVLLLMIACCCVVARRRYADDSSDGTDRPGAEYRGEMVYYTGRTPWRFPWSIPPPTIIPGQPAEYRATDDPQTWTVRT